MSGINELIARLCPDGVEHATLGDLGQFIRGNGLQKADLSEQGFPAIHYGQIHTSYGIWTDTTKSFTDPDRAAKLRRATPGDLVIATTSEDDAAVAKATAWVGKSEVAISGDAYIYRHTLDPKYMSYFFQSESFQRQKRRFITGTKVRRISGDSLARITIPAPPLDVQKEIVAVLDQVSDTESKLAVELKSELEARRRQYFHYRSGLLEFSSDVPRVPLSALATIGTGSRNTNEAVVGGTYPFFVRSQEPLAINEFEFDEQAVITAGDGVGVGKIFHFVDGKYALHQRAYRITSTSERVDTKFLYHLFRVDFGRYLAMTSVHASVTSLRRPMFEKYLIPTPRIEVQRHIVDVLDSLDALVDDLSSSLPAELHARRKQYEYYRDKLMTFEELPA